MSVNLFFLQPTFPDVPCRKTIINKGGRLDITPYPMTKNWTSHNYSINTIDEFLVRLKAHAAEGHVLLKGVLSRDLNDEPRGGSTDKNVPTNWICIDIDGFDGVDSADHFIYKMMPKQFHGVSYIMQHSARSGITPGLRVHLIFLLANYVQAATLRQWLMQLNLTDPAIRDATRLGINGLNLRYPIDVSTCDNGRLIFIADPLIRGLDDPIEERTVIVKKDQDFVQTDFIGHINYASVSGLQGQRIAELRQQAGLKKKQARVKIVGETAVVENPDEISITEEWIIDQGDGRKFVQCNVNGGDSRGYYYWLETPDILHNFKGEDAVRLKDACPQYYVQAIARARAAMRVPGQHVYAIRNRNSDQYLNIIHTQNPAGIEMYPAKDIKRLDDFMRIRGHSLPDPVPDWDVAFDPTTDNLILPQEKWVNLWAPSLILQRARANQNPPDQLPWRTMTIVRNLCGRDIATIVHFINWLAYIVQTRRPTGTGWIFHGVQGTGKGVLFNKILEPIIGGEYCRTMMLDQLMDPFNEWERRCILLQVSESQMEGSAHKPAALSNRLKNLVDEKTHSIRAMRANAEVMTSHINVMVMSNGMDPMPIEDSDRRFNVPEYQARPLKDCFKNGIAEIDNLGSEVNDVAAYLYAYEVDERAARTPMDNKAKIILKEINRTTLEDFVLAIQTGDLDYFLQFSADKPPTQQDKAFAEFMTIIRSWASKVGDKIFVTNTQLRAVYRYTSGTTQDQPAKFGKMLAHRGLHTKMRKVKGIPTRGIDVTWRSEDSQAVLVENVFLIHGGSKDDDKSGKL